MKYTGLWQTMRLVIAEEGWVTLRWPRRDARTCELTGAGRHSAASLYGGLSAHLLRVVPNAACMFTIYEVALRL